MYQFIFMIVMLGAVEVHGKVTCIGENGNAVDMFIIYKLPRVASYPGGNYLYLDSNDMKFRLSTKQISSKSSAPGKTLEQVYAQYNVNTGSESLAHIFYNDGVPGAKRYDHSFGHTKGELAFDKVSGFWIIQSVPNFPNRRTEGYGYPHSGYKYGQMFMCVSFASTAFKDIGLQLKFTKPHIYDSNLPTAWKDDYKNIYDVLKGSSVVTSPYSSIATLTSLKGNKYVHFGKAAKFHHDLYHDLVAPSLKTNLIVESWQHGWHHNNIGPSCKGNYTVVDIRKVFIKVPGKSFSFSIMDDHSKYAIGELSYVPYVCVGDINRQYSQYKRGGGCICVKNFALWEQFKSLVHSSYSCDDLSEKRR